MTPHGRLRLILTRHAKSDWDDPSLDDHDRPLNARGRRAARSLGDWLASRGYEPEEVLCSTALRCTQTWEEATRAALGVRPEICCDSALYHAEPEMMLKLLRKATAPIVMMIGHNPGIAAFAHSLLVRPPQSSEFRSYPTAATVVADFQGERWAEADLLGQGSLRDFVRFDGG